MQEDCRVDDGAVTAAARHQARRQPPQAPARTSTPAPPCSAPGGACGRRISASPPRSASPSCAVYRRLRVALFSTGDEVREPGDGAAARRDLRRQPLHAAGAARGLGCVGQRSRHPARPRRRGARGARRGARETHDLVVTSGGMSTGEEDHVKAAVEALGQAAFLAPRHQARPPGGDGPDRRRAVHRPARQSGRGDGDVPAAGAAADPAPRRRRRDRAAALPRARRLRLRKKASRAEYLRARLERGGDGGWVAAEIPARRRRHPVLAGRVATASSRSARASTELAPGTPVDFLPFSEVIP